MVKWGHKRSNGPKRDLTVGGSGHWAATRLDSEGPKWRKEQANKELAHQCGAGGGLAKCATSWRGSPTPCKDQIRMHSWLAINKSRWVNRFKFWNIRLESQDTPVLSRDLSIPKMILVFTCNVQKCQTVFKSCITFSEFSTNIQPKIRALFYIYACILALPICITCISFICFSQLFHFWFFTKTTTKQWNCRRSNRKIVNSRYLR